jgi:hypothetical protein
LGTTIAMDDGAFVNSVEEAIIARELATVAWAFD